MLICNPKKCSGCGLCENVCPKEAISLRLDKEGFLYPIINENCISCNKCVKLCPQNKNTDTHEANKFFKAYSLDKVLRENSTSGGVIGEIYRYAANLGYYLFGVAFDEDFSCGFIATRSFFDVKKFHGSKYIGAKSNGCYREAEKVLKRGEGVCFVGTPCECAALRNYLQYDYEKLIMVDFICHGVSSEKALRKYIKETEQKHGKIVEYRMRSKDNGYLKFSERFTFLDGTSCVGSFYKDDFGYLFASGISLRRGCYDCKYVGLNRVSDITVGDWTFDIGEENGVSLLIENSVRGGRVIRELIIEGQINVQPLEKDMVIAKTYRLTHALSVPKLRKYILKNIDRVSLSALSKRCQKARLWRGKITWLLHKLRKSLKR